MRPKFTQNFLRFFALKVLAFVLFVAGFASKSQAQILYSQNWNTVAPLPANWASQNLSTSVGSTGWFQGNNAVFPAQSGAPTAYIGANFNNTTGNSTISNWLFAPAVPLNNGDVFRFWTRGTGSTFPDRLQVRLSTNGASVNAGASSTSVGDFTILLEDINPSYQTGASGYPSVWTQYTVTISGVPAPNTLGRVAFRYFVENGGPSGINSDYIGIDEVEYESLPPCTGTPAPGNTVPSVGTVCAGVNFNLTVQNPPAGSGVTYQWQSGPSATGPWTNIGTSATQTVSQTAATWYQAIVTCGGNSGTSTPVQVMLTPVSGCYCIPPDSDCTDDDMITRVRISTLDNSSTCGSGPPAGYSNFTALPAPIVYAGASNPIILNKPGAWAEGAAVWIDYNQNGQFEAGEKTNIAVVPGTTTQLTANINIPSSALTGNTRMRVRMEFNAIPATPCGGLGLGFGETEDYTVNIQPCVPVTVTGSPANASIVCGGNASFTVTTAGSLPVYAWEMKAPSATSWTFVPNSIPFTGVNTSTLTLANVPATYNGYQFRAVVQGGCSATDFSGAATLTVNPIVPAVNPASATICAGTVQQLSLTNSVATVQTGTFNASGLPVAIPDGTFPITTSTAIPITVSGIPAGSIIQNIGLRFSITHPWVGDLVMNLVSPDNVKLSMFALLDGASGSNGTANFTNTVIDSLSTASISGAPAPRTGNFAAEKWLITNPSFGDLMVTNQAWAPFFAGTINGVWNINIADIFAPDPGTVTAASLVITYTAPDFAQGVWTGPAGTMWTNAGATVPYTGTPATTIYVNPTSNAVYQVNFTTVTPCNSATTSVPITVHSPVTGIVHPTNTAACVGNNATFTVSAGGGPLTYQWQVSDDGGLTWDNITGATSATLTVNSVTQSMNNNRYRAVITSGPCGSANSNAAVLTVNALPTVTISAPDLSLAPGQQTTITGASTPAAGANSWTWTLNGSPLAGTTNTQNVNIDGLGTYRARAVDGNGCANFSNELTIGAEASDRLWIYPNPSPGAFQVRLYYGGPVTERRVVSIFNSAGQRMMQKEFTLDNVVSPYLRMDFDLSHMAAGTYVVKVHNTVTGKITSGLVVVQHAN